MTNEQREIHRKKRVFEHAERVGNVNKTCRYFGVARSGSQVGILNEIRRLLELGDRLDRSRVCLSALETVGGRAADRGRSPARATPFGPSRR